MECAKTILVAEDDSAILTLVQTILEAAAFEVLTAGSACEAKRIAEGFPRPIHLLLTDVMMPDVTGPALAKSLGEQRPCLEVILMSGHVESAIFAEDCGWRFLRKPFSSSALLDCINHALS
jgi:DNA-binding NtrC family response regulator